MGDEFSARPSLALFAFHATIEFSCLFDFDCFI